MKCFFFSSRRRHTRWPRDWSSDVCSSDLLEDMSSKEKKKIGSKVRKIEATKGAIRSEERRVGKEWRYRWWPSDKKKKADGKTMRGEGEGEQIKENRIIEEQEERE